MFFIIPFFFFAGSAISANLTNSTDSSGLDWQPCSDLNQLLLDFLHLEVPNFDCANLTVPLDYTDPNSEPLTLNLFRYNATQQPALGSVIINFGGPGGSGAEDLLNWGRGIGANIGPQWNLITWDPRGTGRTIPFNCGDITAPSSANNKRDLALVRANLTDYFVNAGWDWAGSIADQCFATMNDTGRFVSTTSTARDVMAIVDALDEDGMLRYWGWSYGTALGSYLAALFPDRIARMVLDGNLNPWDYQSGTYKDIAHDIDKTFRAFLQECLNNANDCSVAQYTNASSVDEMIARLNQGLQPIIGNVTTQTAWGTYAAVLGYIVTGLYFPSGWPTLANKITNTLKLQLPNSTNPLGPDPYNTGENWNVYGIRAGDAIWHPSSLDEYLPQVQYDANVSAFPVVYPSVWVSARWRITPSERYTGGFNTTTKNPILFINGQYDPVTPIIGAYNASQGFKGSVVLAHTGYGHGIVADPSNCVAQYAQNYFIDGTLPPQGTVCHPDDGPWQLAALGVGIAGTNGSASTSGVPTTTTTTTGNAIGVATSSPTSSVVVASSGGLRNHVEGVLFAVTVLSVAMVMV